MALNNPALKSGPKYADLKRRLWFLLGALVVYRIGTHIPVPGINASVLDELFRQQQGGILEYVHRSIEVECLPADIPEHVEINIGDLMMHQGVRVRDVPVNPKWKPVTDADTMLVHVIMPKAEEAAAPAAEGAVAAAPAAAVEPEVIKKGKKEEGVDEEKEKKK